MSPRTAPTLSVLLAVHDGEAWLADAIQSILSQTYRDFEFILIDDASTDRTSEIIRQHHEDRIVWATISRGGLTKALNYGLRLARGRYVARMDADDVALPERFAKQIDFLERNPDVGVVGTAYDVLTSSGERKKPRVPIYCNDADIRRVLPKFNPLFHGSVILRRDLIEKVGGYDEKFPLAQDYDLWFRLLRHCRFANAKDVLMLRREGEATLQKEARQNWYGVRARFAAIQRGDIGAWNVVHLGRPLLVAILPRGLKSVVRRRLPRAD